jgi:hypothetical protein
MCIHARYVIELFLLNSCLFSMSATTYERGNSSVLAVIRVFIQMVIFINMRLFTGMISLSLVLFAIRPLLGKIY